MKTLQFQCYLLVVWHISVGVIGQKNCDTCSPPDITWISPSSGSRDFEQQLTVGQNVSLAWSTDGSWVGSYADIWLIGATNTGFADVVGMAFDLSIESSYVWHVDVDENILAEDNRFYLQFRPHISSTPDYGFLDGTWGVDCSGIVINKEVTSTTPHSNSSSDGSSTDTHGSDHENTDSGHQSSDSGHEGSSSTHESTSPDHEAAGSSHGPPQDHSGLSAGQKAGIAAGIGCFAVLILIGIPLAAGCYHEKRQKPRHADLTSPVRVHDANMGRRLSEKENCYYKELESAYNPQESQGLGLWQNAHWQQAQGPPVPENYYEPAREWPGPISHH